MSQWSANPRNYGSLKSQIANRLRESLPWLFPFRCLSLLIPSALLRLKWQWSKSTQHRLSSRWAPWSLNMTTFLPLDGRCTTSPAAILLIVSWLKRWIGIYNFLMLWRAQSISLQPVQYVQFITRRTLFYDSSQSRFPYIFLTISYLTSLRPT